MALLCVDMKVINIVHTEATNQLKFTQLNYIE